MISSASAAPVDGGGLTSGLPVQGVVTAGSDTHTVTAVAGQHAKQFDVINDTTIAVISPAEAAGSYNMVVTTPEGTSRSVPADVFTYTPDPA